MGSAMGHDRGMARPIDYQRLIVGYHGCDRSVGEAVLLRGESLRPSRNRYDWLGRGVYFWEHGPERALAWAREMRDRGRIAEPFVLGAFINLGRCFDLTDTFATGRLPDWHRRLGDELHHAGAPVPENGRAFPGDHDLLLRYLDCAVLNSGLDTYEFAPGLQPFQTVRGVFPEGDWAYPGARIRAKTHVQVAVRDQESILGYFRPAH